jgi:hypothetical protein
LLLLMGTTHRMLLCKTAHKLSGRGSTDCCIQGIKSVNEQAQARRIVASPGAPCWANHRDGSQPNY